MSEIKSIGSLNGSISAKSILAGTISAESTLKGTISAESILKGTISAVENYELYEGEYEITPELRITQTLNTANKYLDKNIFINEVPYSVISNTSNGLTVYIGKGSISYG